MSDKPTLRYVQDMMTGKYVFRENGAQRAARRAARAGLTVGAPVRIHYNVPPRQPQPSTYWRKGGPGTGVALERIDRMARYLLQRDVTTHVRHGSNWQPTPRQRRRLDHKARHAAAPFGRDYIAEAYVAGNTPAWPTVDQRAEPVRALIEAGHVIHPDSPAVPRVPMVHTVGRQTEHGPTEPARGFRVVDRRGEHRS